MPEMSFEHVLARLNQHAKPGSLIYLISDFRGFNPQAESYLAKLARHCQVVLIFVYDPLEKALPEQGRYRFTDNQREVVIDSADKMRLFRYQQRFYRKNVAEDINLPELFNLTERWLKAQTSKK
jgi:hypothetical protein